MGRIVSEYHTFFQDEWKSLDSDLKIMSGMLHHDLASGTVSPKQAAKGYVQILTELIRDTAQGDTLLKIPGQNWPFPGQSWPGIRIRWGRTPSGSAWPGEKSR